MFFLVGAEVRTLHLGIEIKSEDKLQVGAYYKVDARIVTDNPKEKNEDPRYVYGFLKYKDHGLFQFPTGETVILQIPKKWEDGRGRLIAMFKLDSFLDSERHVLFPSFEEAKQAIENGKEIRIRGKVYGSCRDREDGEDEMVRMKKLYKDGERWEGIDVYGNTYLFVYD